MPPLLNSRHELFAQYMAAGKTQAEAATLAGYQGQTLESYTSRLVKKRQVRARVEELQGQLQQRVQYNAARVLERLIELVELKASDFERPREEWTDAMERWGCEQEDVSKRSHDGVQAGESKSWDKIGIRFKIPVRDKLKALELIARHKAIDALVAQGATSKDIADGVAEGINRIIAEGRQRAAQRGIPEKAE